MGIRNIYLTNIECGLVSFENYISESEAVSISGVSVDTLRRFVETGHLAIESDGDGLKLYSKDGIQKLFGLATLKRPSKSKSAPVTISEVNSVEQPRIVNSEPLRSMHRVKVDVVGTTTRSNIQTREPESASEQQNQVPETNSATHLRVLDGGVLPDEPKQEPNSTAIRTMEREIFKLERITSMQEELLKVKDCQIEDLRGQLKKLEEQSNWLKSRIEKMEISSERDQFLIMAKTDTVMKLITQRKRSTVRAALEWLGVVSNEPSTNGRTGSTVTVESEDR